jgi:hypothetical protein
MNGEHYNIETLADMAAIPESARGRFLAELPSILSTMSQMQEISAIMQSVGLGRIKPGVAVWIDDDKGESTVKIHADGERLVDIKTMMCGAS